MILLPSVIILCIASARQALIIPKWRLLRSVSPSSLGHPFHRTATTVCSSMSSSLDDVRKRMMAIEWCLTTMGKKEEVPPSDIRDFVQFYQLMNKGDIHKLYVALQGKKTALVGSKASVVNKGLVVVGGEFSSVWNAIVNHPIVEDKDNPRLWSLHGGIKWIGRVQKLYNRPCYDEITKKLSSSTRVLVDGTTGIGKTLYLQAFMVHLVRQARAEGKDLPSIYYKRSNNERTDTVSFLSDGSVMDISNVRCPPDPDYLLSDGVDISMPSGKILNLLMASDASCRSFEKRIREVGTMGDIFVMPLFTLDELRSIRPDMDDWYAEFRYDVFGGSAREFIAVQERSHFYLLPIVDETLTQMFPDVKEMHYAEWDAVARQVSAELLMMLARYENIATISNMMWFMQPGGSKTWASRYIEWLAAAMVDNRIEVDKLERVIGKAVVARSVVKALAHRRLIRSTVPILLKPLSATLSPTKPAFESAQFDLPLVRFKTIDEIKNLPNGTYGLPMDRNFPAVDAVIQPDTLIQIITSPEQQPEESFAKLADIRAHLRASPEDHRIIFVVPPENIQTIRYHPQLEGMRQLVCVIDSSVDSSDVIDEWLL